uniref:Uncharacterized protein n=1 Tax=Haptolina brevifila TaxID=156173 RepID=A0A7S2IVP3_9EUKA|mmetsp:Transcript_72521/g.144041  ORF Transcript_72521/g.144041 Transcript_72521/m.144041 type:complete len:106 (+) Transcript_72521:217-534(+)
MLLGSTAVSAIPEQLWLAVCGGPGPYKHVDAHQRCFLSAAWDSNPANRPSAEKLHSQMMQAIKQFKVEQPQFFASGSLARDQPHPKAPAPSRPSTTGRGKMPMDR